MASSYMTFTPSGAGTSHRTGTISAWLKRADVSSSQRFWGVRYDASHTCEVTFNEYIQIFANYGGSTQINLRTTAKYQDPAAWYHVVVAIDTEQSVEADRVKLYVNGVQNSTFSTYTTYPAEDANLLIGHGYPTSVGAMGAEGSNMWNGCISWAQYVDGLQLAPTEFGETDSTSGIWKIKTDVYGTPGINGFCLKMEDRTNLDLDSSSNAHTFTTVGTPTATYDSPSNNFATLNPLDGNISNSGGLLNGNTNYNKTSTGSGYNTTCLSTLGVSAGKWYWECKATDVVTSDCVLGFMSTGHGPYDSHYQLFNLSTTPNAYGYRNNGTKYVGNVQTTSFFNTFVDGDIISFAMDLDNGKCYAAKNGTWENSGDPTSGATGTGSFADITDLTQFYVPAVSNYNYTDATKVDFNYGNGYFGTTAVSSAEADDAGIGAMEYDVPAGYYCICTKNIKAYGG